MLRYTLLLLWSLAVAPVQAQISQCEVINLTDAIVVSEYLPCSRIDSFYIEGNHYIYFDGRAIPFKTNASFNKFIIDHFKSNVYIPECLYTIDVRPRG